MFPHEIVKRFFTGSYDDESCRRIAVFYADGNWYARKGYERFGAHVSPYKDDEIELPHVEW